MKEKWKRISIALTEREIDMLKVAKKYFGLNNREILMGTIGVIWDSITKKYKKEYGKKWEKHQKKIKEKILKNKLSPGKKIIRQKLKIG